MLSISIEHPRKRQPFFKFCLAKEMPAMFEIMFGGRICGCYILTMFFYYFWRTDGRATGGADPNAIRNWCFVEADGVYFYCFSMIVDGFAEATTDTICVFYFFNETSIVSTQNLHFDSVRHGEQGGA